MNVKFAESAETVSEIGESIGYYMTVCGGLSGCANYIKDLENITLEDVKVGKIIFMSDADVDRIVLNCRKMLFV